MLAESLPFALVMYVLLLGLLHQSVFVVVFVQEFSFSSTNPLYSVLIKASSEDLVPLLGM